MAVLTTIVKSGKHNFKNNHFNVESSRLFLILYYIVSVVSRLLPHASES